MELVFVVELETFDYLLLGVDILVLAIGAIYYALQGTTAKKCRSIVIKEDNLKIWRFGLYTSIYSAWFASIFTFLNPSIIRGIFHFSFFVATTYLLKLSLPKWVCKTRSYGGMCNCDLYEYNDFIPIVILGIFGSLFYAFFDFSNFAGLFFLTVLIILSFGILFLLPKKEFAPLKYPKELLLSNVDDLQSFLYQNPHDRKLITVLKATCDFCEIQVNELNEISMDLLVNHLRIFDLSYNIDPVLGMQLNIDDVSDVPVPSTRVYDSGMEVDLKEGVLSRTEIEALLLSASF